MELELIELPERVRVRLVANVRFTPSNIVVDNEDARKLRAVGLGEQLARVHGDVIEFVPLQVTKDFAAPVVERRQLDAMLKIDTRLRDCIAAGEIVVEQLSEQESKAIEGQIWRDVDWQSRPKRQRKKIGPRLRRRCWRALTNTDPVTANHAMWQARSVTCDLVVSTAH